MKDHKIGIDRILCKNLNIKQVDLDLLKAKGFTIIQDNDKSIRILNDKEGQAVYINYIKVSRKQDDTLKINELRIGQKEIETNVFNKIEYDHLDVTLPKTISDTKTNESNINNTIDLLRSIKAIEDELEGLGFGRVDLLETELKQLEININIDLDRPFKEYESVLNYMQDLLPRRIKTDINNNYRPNEIYTGFKVGNQSINLKMYDKRSNIKRISGQDIGRERLRIEYSLLSERKIRETLGSDRLGEIVKDDFKLIDKTFKKLLEDDLIKRLYKDIGDQIKHATSEIKRYKDTKTKLSGMEYIYDHDVIDIEIVLKAIKENTRSNHFARECKTLINRSIEGKQINLFGNMEKINEILKKLGQDPVEIKLTNHVKKELKKHY